jgi:hypothetical protein
MRFFTLESLRRTIIWRGGKARPCSPTLTGFPILCDRMISDSFYKGEIFRLNSENEKLREDLDALEQYGRRELMRINGIPDGGQQETTANTFL